MAIRNVISTLPDPKYVAALERELAELRQEMSRIASLVGTSSRV